jgi:hypothetical protein
MLLSIYVAKPRLGIDPLGKCSSTVDMLQPHVLADASITAIQHKNYMRA